MKFWILMGIMIGSFIQTNSAQSYTRVNYDVSDSIITNPERGWYKYSELWASQSSNNFLDTTSLKAIRLNGYTLLYRIVYLDSYKNGDIAPEFLDNLNKDFEVIRKSGLKVVLRFAYTTNTNYPIGDAPVNIVLRHIQQLKPLLQENSDVIMTLQAGFIGAWGEWYYTDYYSTPNDSANWSLRAKIVDAEMDALPKNRMIQIRYVPYLSKLAKDTSVLQAAQAYSGTLKARIAHHNDCFVADLSNEGTYTNLQKDRSYLSRDSKYMVVGGETCQVQSPYSDCPNSTNDLATMHWTFLNIDYNTAVYANWKAEGCMDDIWKKLGYRYRLLYASVQDTSKSGGVVNVTIKLINDGYSNPVNPRNVELILRNKTSKEEYKLAYLGDIRLLPLNDTITLTFNGGLPLGVAEGSYDLFLDMPDPEIRLYDNPLYSIRTVNNNSWERTSGYNKLNSVLTVKNNAMVSNYTGSQFFVSKIKPISNSYPTPLKTNVFSNNVLLYWGVNNRKYYQALERAKLPGQFEPLITLSPGVTSYTDRNLQANTSYNYRMHLISADSSSLSDSVFVSIGKGNRYFVNIKSDNSIDDWSAISPISALFQNNTTSSVRFFNKTDSLYIYGENSLNARMYINNDSLGLQNIYFPGIGFNYMISNDTLYSIINNQWTFSTKIACVTDSNLFKYAISFKDLPIFQNKSECFLGAVLNLRILPDTGLGIIKKVLFPISPQNFAVTNNPYIPNTSLYLSWNSVAGATSYIVERSDGNPSNFVENQEVFDNRGSHIDLNLDQTITYYYRVAAINDLLRSVYSDTLHGMTESLSVKKIENPSIKVYPNPISHNETLFIKLSSGDFNKIELITVSGVKLYSTNANYNSISIPLPELTITPGIYFLNIQGDRNVIQKVKLIIY